MVLFIGYLIEKKRKASTIRSYISAIKGVLREDGMELVENRFLLNSLTNTCKLINDHVRTRLPIQFGMLEILIQKLNQMFAAQPYLLILYRTILITAYYGLFRVGELNKGDHPVKVTDVHIGENKRKALFILRTSKTHWKDSPPQSVKIIGSKGE